MTIMDNQDVKSADAEAQAKVAAEISVPSGVPAEIPDPKVLEIPRALRCKNKFTIFLVEGAPYPVTSDAKTPAELHSRMFLDEETLAALKLEPVLTRSFGDDDDEVVCYYFAEAVVQANGPEAVEGIREGWEPEEEWGPNEDEDEGKRRPKRPKAW